MIGNKIASVVALAWFLPAAVFAAPSPAPINPQRGSRHPYAAKGRVATPRIFAPGTISTEDDEAGGTFSPDGTEFYFAKYVQYTTYPRIGILCVSHLRGGRWTKPEVLPFSGKYWDLPPYLSPDGKTMYFSSSRPAPGTSARVIRIWSVERGASGWGEPQPLPAPVNAPEDRWNLGASAARDGTLYFSSDREQQQHFHIYRARRVNGKYQEPEKLGPAINSEFNESQPFISPDGNILLFAASGQDEPPFGKRADTLLTGGNPYARADLYVSVNRNGEWTPARHLEHDINTVADEGFPAISPDGRYLFFSSERSPFTIPTRRRLRYGDLDRQLRSLLNGHGNIFYIGIESLDLDQPARKGNAP